VVVATLALVACSANPSPSATSAAISTAPSATASATAVPTPDIHEAVVIARIPLPQPAPQTALEHQTAVTNDAIWVQGASGRQLARIDLATNRVTATIPIEPSALVAGDGQLWSISPVDVAPEPPAITLSRIDLATGAVREVAQIPSASTLAVGLGAVWVIAVTDLIKIDPTTGRTLATWPTLARDVFVGCGAVWNFGFSESGSFMAPVDVEAGPGGVVGTLPLTLQFRPNMFGSADSCWLVDDYGVHPFVGGELAEPVLPACCGELAVVGNSLWLTAPDGLISRVDAATGAVLERWAIPAQDLFLDPKGNPDWRLLSAGGNLWLLTGAEAIRFEIPNT
jgi:hypothetical protein